LAADLQKAFPGTEGFSPRNIWRMRAFYLAWTDEVNKLPRPVAGLDGRNLPQSVAEMRLRQQQTEAARLDAAIAANLKELGFGE